MAYDYNYAVKDDCINAIRDMMATGTLDTTEYADRDELAEFLNDDLWTDDSVTGNGSGSYTFSSEEAHKCVRGNEGLLKDMIHDWCLSAESVLDHFMDEDWEYFDVSLRCYVLSSAIYEALDTLETLGVIHYHYDDDDEGR